MIHAKDGYKQANEPMLIPEMPNEPWQKVGTDLFHVNGKDFLLVIDITQTTLK